LIHHSLPHEKPQCSPFPPHTITLFLTRPYTCAYIHSQK
jgi:hypothetical protein